MEFLLQVISSFRIGALDSTLNTDRVTNRATHPLPVQVETPKPDGSAERVGEQRREAVSLPICVQSGNGIHRTVVAQKWQKRHYSTLYHSTYFTDNVLKLIF